MLLPYFRPALNYDHCKNIFFSLIGVLSLIWPAGSEFNLCNRSCSVYHDVLTTICIFLRLHGSQPITSLKSSGTLATVPAYASLTVLPHQRFLNIFEKIRLHPQQPFTQQIHLPAASLLGLVRLLILRGCSGVLF